MTALAAHHAPAAVPVVQMICPRIGCAHAGQMVEVDWDAITFARELSDHVRCARCRRPLVPLPRRTSA